MLCFKCGKEIADASKFCPHCGAVLSGEGAASPAAGPGAGAPPTGGGMSKKGMGKGLLIGGAAVAVVALALAVAALAGLFSSPKGRLEAAFAKTAAAYLEAGQGLDLPDLSALAGGAPVTQRFSVELSGVNSALTGYDLSALSGLGVRATTDIDREGRRIGCEASAFWGEEELASFQLAVDDNVAGIASPQFTGGEFYGVDTETLGADLARLGVEEGGVEVERISFNLFDLMEALTPGQDETEEMEKRLGQAGKDLLDAAQVDKKGREDIQVNGSGVEADVYHVTLPEQAVKDYADVLEQAMELADSRDGMELLLRSMGVPEDEIGAALAGMENGGPYGGMADSLRRLAEEQGGLELDVYVNGEGYVSAVTYEGQADGPAASVRLYLGGGGNYVDELSLEIDSQDGRVSLTSSGDHGAVNGAFTDETILRAGGVRLTSRLRYDPKGTQDNFEWELGVTGAVSVELKGRLTAGEDSVEAKLDSVRVKAAEVEVCSLRAEYYLGPCGQAAVSAPGPKLLGSMDEAGLMEVYDSVQANAQAWMYGVIALIPPELLWQLL